uniref:Tandem C2 domains, nuclear n=1 Tax=Cyprinus carpio TaxID=7962 RepID=A0A8C2IHS7_CYPCA
ILNMTEYIKNCCRTFMSKKNEPEIQMIKVRPPGKLTAESNVKKNVGVSEDYLLSKLPPDGREVPFIIPTFKPSYIQPRGSQYSGYNIGQQSKQYDLRYDSVSSVQSSTSSIQDSFGSSRSLEQIRRSALVLRLQAHTPRKRTLGECVLSLRTLGPEATKHCLEFKPYSKTHVCHAELQLALCFQPVNSRMQLQILSAQNLSSSSSPLTQSFFVKVELLSEARVLLKRKTKVMKSSGGQIQWAEVLHLPITNQDQNLQLAVKLYSRSSVRRKHLLGQVSSDSPEAVEQWRDSMANPEKVVTSWHRLSRL